MKLKGLAVTRLQDMGPQVWDVADYVFPAHVSCTGLPPIGPGLRLSEGSVQLPALWASVSLTVSLHGDILGCGVCWVSGGLQRPSGAVFYHFGAVLPNPLHHLSALHFQGDSSFVVMTNFIMTPQQSQGHCAEVRTPPFSWTHRGENIMESPWALVVMWDEFSDYGYDVMFDRESYKITLRH